MAENEYLDSSKNRKWRAVTHAIRQGSYTVLEIQDKVAHCFYDSMRRIKSELPLNRMIDAIERPESLHAVLREISGAVDVKDFMRQAAIVEGTKEEKIGHFLDLSLSNCLSDIPYEVAKNGEASISDARDTLNHVRDNLESDLKRQAKKLSANSDWNPRRENGSVNSADQTVRMLSESLLTGSP